MIESSNDNNKTSFFLHCSEKKEKERERGDNELRAHRPSFRRWLELGTWNCEKVSDPKLVEALCRGRESTGCCQRELSWENRWWRRHRRRPRRWPRGAPRGGWRRRGSDNEGDGNRKRGQGGRSMGGVWEEENGGVIEELD